MYIIFWPLLSVVTNVSIRNKELAGQTSKQVGSALQCTTVRLASSKVLDIYYRAWKGASYSPTICQNVVIPQKARCNNRKYFTFSDRPGPDISVVGSILFSERTDGQHVWNWWPPISSWNIYRGYPRIYIHPFHSKWLIYFTIYLPYIFLYFEFWPMPCLKLVSRCHISDHLHSRLIVPWPTLRFPLPTTWTLTSTVELHSARLPSSWCLEQFKARKTRLKWAFQSYSYA